MNENYNDNSSVSYNMDNYRYKFIETSSVSVLYNHMKKHENYIPLDKHNLVTLELYTEVLENKDKYFKLYICLEDEDFLYYKKVSNKMFYRIFVEFLNDKIIVPFDIIGMGLFIPVEIASFIKVPESSYAIDFFYDYKLSVHNDSEYNNVSSMENKRFNYAYDKDICYIDYFKCLRTPLHTNYLTIRNYISKDLCEIKINLNVFSKIDIRITSILYYLNKKFFDMIINQQKAVYYIFMYGISKKNENSHESFGNISLMLYRNAKANFKEKLIDENTFKKIGKGRKKIAKLLRRSKLNKNKCNRDHVRFIKERLTCPFSTGQLEAIEEMKLINRSPNDYYKLSLETIYGKKEVSNGRDKFLHGQNSFSKNQKKVLERLIQIIFDQTKVKENKIYYSRNIDYYSEILIKNKNIMK